MGVSPRLGTNFLANPLAMVAVTAVILSHRQRLRLANFLLIKSPPLLGQGEGGGFSPGDSMRNSGCFLSPMLNTVLSGEGLGLI